MDGDLIKILVVAVVLFLSWVSKGLEKKAQRQRGGSAGAPRKSGLDLLADLEKRLREAQRAAEAQTRGAPTAARPRAAPPAPAPAARSPVAVETTATPQRPSTGSEVSARHLETHVGGLESHHLADAVETRRLELDLTQAREGHAAILSTEPANTGADVGTSRRAGSRFDPAAALPARLSELQRALVWGEVLGKPVALRESSDRP